MSDDKLIQIQKLLDSAEGNLHSARNLMREVVGSGNAPTINHEERAKGLNVSEEGRITEGIYNGEAMVGPDGKEYPVPANYASKSKLVEGDVLKLTIADDGSFIFKQISPLERRKTIGSLVYTDGSYTVAADGKNYKVLQASVTYYKGEAGDQVTLILPKDHESTWGAVENIIKKTDSAVPEQTVNDEITNTDAITQTPQEDQPEIEYPKNPQSAEPTTDDESASVADVIPAEELTKTDEINVPEATEEKPDEGIKELEI